MSDKFDFWSSVENQTETNYTAELLSTKFTIDEYQDFNYKIDWLDFLSNLVHPVANITGSDYVVFPKTDFMDAFFTLIKRTRKRYASLSTIAKQVRLTEINKLIEFRQIT